MNSITSYNSEDPFFFWRRDRQTKPGERTTWVQNNDCNLVIRSVCNHTSKPLCPSLEFFLWNSHNNIFSTTIGEGKKTNCIKEIVHHSRLDFTIRQPDEVDYNVKSGLVKYCETCLKLDLCEYAHQQPQKVKDYLKNKTSLPPSLIPYTIRLWDQHDASETSVAWVCINKPFINMLILFKCPFMEKCREIQKIAQSAFLFLVANYHPLPFTPRCITYILCQQPTYPPDYRLKQIQGWIKGEDVMLKRTQTNKQYFQSDEKEHKS